MPIPTTKQDPLTVRRAQNKGLNKLVYTYLGGNYKGNQGKVMGNSGNSMLIISDDEHEGVMRVGDIDGCVDGWCIHRLVEPNFIDDIHMICLLNTMDFCKYS